MCLYWWSTNNQILKLVFYFGFGDLLTILGKSFFFDFEYYCPFSKILCVVWYFLIMCVSVSIGDGLEQVIFFK